MAHELREIFSQVLINNRVKELARELSEVYKTEPVACICVLKGAVYFFSDLVRALSTAVEIDFVCVSSYGNGMEPGNEIILSKDVGISLENKHVLIIEDIVDTGHTVNYLKKIFENRRAKSVKVCALIDKGERREIETEVDYYGFRAQGFLVGYGLDYAEKYRELTAIYELQTC